jgi:hypothetical protein
MLLKYYDGRAQVLGWVGIGGGANGTERHML